MNRELQDLLVEAGYTEASSPDAWTRIIVMNNYGSVPRPSGISGEFAQKGFKLLLLGADGRPSHFARCGAANDHALERECRLLETLCRASGLSRIIPESHCVSSPVVRVQLNSYVPGPTYERFVARQSARDWTRCIGEILDARGQVSSRAGELFPDLLAGGPIVAPLEEAMPHFNRLREAGIEPNYLTVLEDALGAVPPLPRVLQHGDLWPANVIRYEGSWWLIDFAEFGHVQVPLYDAFHLLESNPGRRDPRNRHAWLTLGNGAIEDEWTDASRAVVSAAAKATALDLDQVGAALVYYLVHLSAYRLREGVPREFGENYIRELRRVAMQLQRDPSLERLIAN
jgi:phosphotransferase family enzyme